MAGNVFAALLAFAFVSSITPGPNNLMLLSSGVNFGFWRTIPHMLGIATGFASLLLAVGFGLGAFLVSYPSFHLALKLAGGAYLVYLAWRIATSRKVSQVETKATPLSLIAAASFQWVNPKAWVMAITAMALFSDPQARLQTILLITAVFVVVNLPSISVWVGFGTAMRGFLSDPYRLRNFNVAMGLLLVASLFPMLI